MDRVDIAKLGFKLDTAEFKSIQFYNKKIGLSYYELKLLCYKFGIKDKTYLYNILKYMYLHNDDLGIFEKEKREGL